MDSLGDRMKMWENTERRYLYKKTPVIIRLDGKAFHTFTKGCDKPFDKKIVTAMADTTEHLIRNIQGAKVAYVQSDEITILLTDFDKLETGAWFDYNVQKMVSISASMASVYFTLRYSSLLMRESSKPAHFDSRVFNIPKEDVMNNFRWRYQDWLRNSIQMLARSLYSQKELHGKKTPDLHEMCFKKGKNWNDLDPQYKNGTLFFFGTSGKLYKVTDFNLNNNDFANKLFNRFLYPEV